MKAARRAALALVTCVTIASPWGASAQSELPFSRPLPNGSPILVVDQQRLFEGSGVSAQVTAEVEERGRLLAEENRRIEAELGAEELELTQQRPSLEPAEFRALADAFDEKVQRLRAEQDRKELELQRLRDEGLQSFLRQVTPVIEAIVAERGALLVLDRRVALLPPSAEIDITDEAIARINAALEQGGQDPATPPATDQESDP